MARPASLPPATRGLTIDWSVILAAVLAAGLLAAATLRSAPPGGVGAEGTLGGLRLLQAGDVLVAFEDFATGSGGWTPAARVTDDPALGTVLGPMAGAALRTRYTLPDGTETLRVDLGLVLIGDWRDRVITVEAGAVTLDAGADGAVAPEAADRIAARATPGDGHTTLALRLALPAAPGDWPLALSARGGDPASPATWALDSVTVVAVTGD